MKLILHIGAPKTGSTAIQSALRLNKSLIAKKGGYFFDADARALTTFFVKPGRGFFLQERLRHGDEATARAWSGEQWVRLEQAVDERQPDFAVVSSEHFMNPGTLRRILERFRQRFSDIAAIGYVRDPLDLYPSGIDQRIRGGATFARLPTPGGFPYAFDQKLRRIRRFLGAENLTIRNFSRSNLHEGDIVHDFMRILGLRAGVSLDGFETPPRTNDSLCASAALWLLSVNEQLDYLSPSLDTNIAKTRYETIQRLRSNEDLKRFPKLRLDHPALVAALRHATRDACRFLNEHFLHDQEPLTGPDIVAEGPVPDSDAQRAAIREWLMSQFDAAAFQRILAIADKGEQARG